jgi:hypothetical protein
LGLAHPESKSWEATTGVKWRRMLDIGVEAHRTMIEATKAGKLQPPQSTLWARLWFSLLHLTVYTHALLLFRV